MERAIVDRLRPFHPGRVVLFGSRARDATGSGGDFDLLVVIDLPDPDGPRTPAVRLALGDLPGAFDIVVYTPEEWESWSEHPLSFANHVRETGRVLYAA